MDDAGRGWARRAGNPAQPDDSSVFTCRAAATGAVHRIAAIQRRASRRRIGLLGTMLVGALSLVPPALAEDAPYRLGAEDHVRIKVFEWRASQDVIVEWKAMNDEFIVQTSGTLPVPFAGDIPAEGRTTSEVAQLIADRLSERMHLVALPDVSVNIIKYRPFYVAGDVIRPGPYPHQPHLTVLEAVATAGGTPRPADMGLVRLGREVIEGQGELEDLSHESDALLIRRARLQAEIAKADMFSLPRRIEDRRNDPAVARLIQNETQLFTARRQALLTQTEALNTLQSFLLKEADSLKAQLATLDTQMSLVNKELGGIAPLVEKGMIIAPRQLALERTVAQIQGDRLNMQTGALRVQTEVSRTNIALIDLKNNRMTESTIELRDTQIKIDSLANRSKTRQQLLYEAQVAAPKLIEGRLRQALLRPSFAIVRNVDGKPTETSATDASEVLPGDTVRVSLPLPDDMSEGGEEADLSAAPQKSTN